MRPAGRGELESLYFCYPTFEAAPVLELDGQRPRHPVAIVGGGPIGMTAALALARYGVRSVLIESKRTFNDGSRAICVARASFQILQQIGASEPFLAKALGSVRGRPPAAPASTPSWPMEGTFSTWRAAVSRASPSWMTPWARSWPSSIASLRASIRISPRL